MITGADLEFLIFIKEQDPSDNILKIDYGRRQGHSTAVQEIASHQDIVVTPVLMRGLSSADKKFTNIITYENMNYWRGINVPNLRYVFVDPATSVYSENELFNIMVHLSKYNPKLFILLQ